MNTQAQADPRNVGADLMQALGVEETRGPTPPGQANPAGHTPRSPDVELEQAIRNFAEEETERRGRFDPPPNGNGGDPDALGDDFSFLDLDQADLDPAVQAQRQAAEQARQQQQQQTLEQGFESPQGLVDHVSPGAETIMAAAQSVGNQLQMIEHALQRQHQYLHSQEMQQLEREDPGEAALIQNKMSDRRQELVEAYRRLQPQARQIHATFANEARRKFMGECQRVIPEWANAHTAQREITEMRKHAKSHLGYDDARLANIWDTGEIQALRDSWLQHQAKHGTGQQRERAGKVIRTRGRRDFNSEYDKKVKALEARKRGGRVSTNDKYSALARTLTEMGYSL